MGKKGASVFKGWREGLILLSLVLLLVPSLFGQEYKTIFQVKRDLEKVPPSKDFDFLLKVGNGCIEFGLYLEAEIVLYKVTDLFPDSPEGSRLLSQTFCLQGSRRTQHAMRARARAELLTKILAVTRKKN